MIQTLVIITYFTVAVYVDINSKIFTELILIKYVIFWSNSPFFGHFHKHLRYMFILLLTIRSRAIKFKWPHQPVLRTNIFAYCYVQIRIWVKFGRLTAIPICHTTTAGYIFRTCITHVSRQKIKSKLCNEKKKLFDIFEGIMKYSCSY